MHCRFGRKRLMSGALWAFIVVSVLGSVAPSYPLFLVCRLVMAFTGTIVYQASYILGNNIRILLSFLLFLLLLLLLLLKLFGFSVFSPVLYYTLSKNIRARKKKTG